MCSEARALASRPIQYNNYVPYKKNQAACTRGDSHYMYVGIPWSHYATNKGDQQAATLFIDRPPQTVTDKRKNRKVTIGPASKIVSINMTGTSIQYSIYTKCYDCVCVCMHMHMYNNNYVPYENNQAACTRGDSHYMYVGISWIHYATTTEGRGEGERQHWLACPLGL